MVESHADRMKRLAAEQQGKVERAREKRGVVVVHTGEGKGKSTAAFGIALRSVGAGHRVGLVQFIKGTWKTGERAALARLGEIDHVVSGEGFTWKTQDRERDCAAARRGWEVAREMIEASREPSPRYQVVILDEINVALSLGLLDAADVVTALRERPRELSVVLTGRGAPQAIVDAADTVTEMRKVKHAFEAGVRARRGIEF